MKKMLAVMGMVLLTGSLYAANFGPFSYDDVGSYINGNQVTGKIVASSTTINATTPSIVGQSAVCNTCTYDPGSLYAECLSTATSKGAWVIASSTTIRCK